MIKYKCSNGNLISEAGIKAKLSAAYRSWYQDGTPVCEGCGKVRAMGTAHIISKARCKTLLHTEWIWAKWNTFPACHSCNTLSETSSLVTLLNKDKILEILKKYDEERYNKLDL
jgi:5-methylcytosine-specific restriction endonuclease McrA